METFKIKSSYDGLMLYGLIEEPKKKPVGIVQISHGMAENKERYKDFMKFLSNHGYIAVIHDHRGHGKSAKTEDNFGYFDENKNILKDELYEVTKFIKKKYPNLKITLFAHSMGSLVARMYIQDYDDMIDKLILCGAPTYNPFSLLGSLLAKISGKIHGEKYRSKFINDLVFRKHNKSYNIPNSWICSDEKVVSKYNSSKYCGFIFTIDGFKMLFYMMRTVFTKHMYKVKNANIPIFLIGGANDPVIGGKRKFNHLCKFLKDVGYSNLKSKLYPNMRHEILNEKGKELVYENILAFINDN